MNDRELLVSQLSSIARRGLLNAGSVASEAADQLDNGTVNSGYIIDYWRKMFDITCLTMIEIGETLAAKPQPRSNDCPTFGPFAVPTRADVDRYLHFSGLPVRFGSTDEVPASKLSFEHTWDSESDSPVGLLPAGAVTFRLTVDTTDLPCGVYTADVCVASTASLLSERAEHARPLEIAIQFPV